MTDTSTMTTEQQRQAVIDEAMTWQGTPHHNGAHIKGAGVDCGWLPIMVYSAVGLMPSVEPGRYPPDFMLHRNEEWYKTIADKYGKPLADGQTPKKGDFVLYKMGRIYSHGAIVIEWPRIIHSWTGQGVIQGVGDQGFLQNREKIFYTLWED